MNVPVCCMVCRKATATFMVKDIGLKTYPVCPSCKKAMIVVDVKKIGS